MEAKRFGGCGASRIIDYRKEQDFCGWRDLLYLDRRLEAIHHRQVYVEEDNVGLQCSNSFNGLAAICGIAANVNRMPE